MDHLDHFRFIIFSIGNGRRPISLKKLRQTEGKMVTRQGRLDTLAQNGVRGQDNGLLSDLSSDILAR